MLIITTRYYGFCRKYANFHQKVISNSFTSEKSTLKAPHAFFVACRLPRQMATEETYDDIASQCTDKIIQIVDPDKRLDMFVLPKVLSRWPSFYTVKQRLATNPNLFFHRVSSSHSLRFKATIYLLRSNQQVISTGLSGIGKSSEFNAYLMEFLANIGTVGWPREVWYRYDKVLLMFRLSEQGVPIVVEENIVSLDVLEVRTRIFEFEPLLENKPVLFLELQEGEGNPCSYIATLIHLSNRNVYNITKEFAKAGAKYMLIDPTTTNDLCKMACMEAKFGADSVFQGMDEESIVDTVTARVNIVGPNPRSVLVTEAIFDTECADLEQNVDSLFEVVCQLSVDNLPKYTKHFIAPFVKDDSVVPYLKGGAYVGYSLRFLSEYIALLVAKECTSEARRDILRLHKKHKFLQLIQEYIVRHGLMDRTVLEKKFIRTMKLRDNWFVETWTFFKNASSEKAVSFKATGITTKCNRVEYFDAMYLERPVIELQEHTLYVSRNNIGALYDCMYVDHKKKIVFAFHSSDNKASHKDSLELSTIAKAMLKLQLPVHKYKMRYFYCCSSDDSKVLSQGCILKRDNNNSISSEEERSLAKAMKIYIARIKFFEE